MYIYIYKNETLLSTSSKVSTDDCFSRSTLAGLLLTAVL